MKKSLMGLCLVLTVGASAKNLQGRFGVGPAATDFSQGLSALSMRYHFDPFLSTDVQVAFDTSDENNSSRIGAKICRNVSMEENINFYLGAGLFMIAIKKSAASLQGGGELDGIIGMEFFLTGLPSLGLMVETGLSLHSISSISFNSMGSGFAGGGIHYYF